MNENDPLPFTPTIGDMERLHAEFDRCLDLLMDCVNQGCRENDGRLCTMALSSYEDAIAYLVKRGKARWVKDKEGFIAEWSNE